MAHVNAPETAPDCSEAPNMHRGGAVAIDMTDRVPEQSSLRPVLGRVEDTPPAARHDHNPAMHIEGTAELAPTQIPLRIPYTEGWSRDWDALRASTRHRMFANNVTTATSVPRQESTEMDVGSGQREGPFQDSIGWIVRYLAEQDSVTPQKKRKRIHSAYAASRRLCWVGRSMDVSRCTGTRIKQGSWHHACIWCTYSAYHARTVSEPFALCPK